MLANDGRLSLDDEARKYVPQLPDFGVPITIRQLMRRFPARSIALSGYACGTGLTSSCAFMRNECRLAYQAAAEMVSGVLTTDCVLPGINPPGRFGASNSGHGRDPQLSGAGFAA
jgi:hypothetical protein